jgi:hypothetical protein
MTATDLVALAQRLVELDREAAEVRREMLAHLANGAGDPPARPTSARSPKATGKVSGKRAATMEAAEEAERAIVALLQTQPMRNAEIARETRAKVNTVSERLSRLARKGMAQRGADGAWSVASTPTSSTASPSP